MQPGDRDERSPEFERRSLEVLETLLSLEAEERRAALDRLCGADAALRAAVLELLGAEDRGDWFGLLLSDRDSLIGARLGPWRIESELGRGGMGTVYRALRDDGTYEARVAIKVLRFGFESEVALLLFQRERELLARLSHSSIARLIDGGVTPDGRPWMAMDLVDGVPIDRYCQERGLDTSARVRLAVQVCDAVAWLHQHLVVHRDLKPSNVFVTDDGRVRLLDFGIAKALGAPMALGGAHGDATRGLGRMWTPDYASPEQVRGEPVSTRSDVYSLGVVLFALLTGSKPYETTDASDLEIARIVCENQACRPSQMVADPDVARELRGDLDAIVARCLEKDPELRYASAQRLADDLRRHLGGLPVEARPDSFRYRAGKWLRRNRGRVAVAGVLTIAASAALGWQQRAARAAERADAATGELRRSALEDLFEVDRALRNLRGALEVRRILIENAIERLEAIRDSGTRDEEVSRSLASAWLRISELQWSSLREGLDLPEESLASVESCFESLAEARDGGPTALDGALDGLAMLETSARIQRCALLRRLGRLDEAREEADNARQLVRALVSADIDGAEVLFVQAVEQKRQLLIATGQFLEAADQLLREDLLWLERNFRGRGGSDAELGMGAWMHSVQRLQVEGRTQDAEREARRLLVALESLPVDTSQADVARWRAIAYGFLGSIANRRGDTEAAERWDASSLSAWEERVAAYPKDPVALRSVGRLRAAKGDRHRARGEYEESLRNLRLALAAHEKSTEIAVGNLDAQLMIGVTLDALGETLHAAGDHAAALEQHMRARDVFEKLVGADGVDSPFARDSAVCLFMLAGCRHALLEDLEDDALVREHIEAAIAEIDLGLSRMDRSNQNSFHGQQDAGNFQKLEALRADLVARLAAL